MGSAWKLADKIPAELADDLNRDPNMIEAMVTAAMEYKIINPYEMSVEAQLTALRRANDEEKGVRQRLGTATKQARK